MGLINRNNMNKMKILLLGLILLSFSLYAHAQSGFESYMKVSLGYSFLGAKTDNSNFAMMGPSKIFKFPSIKVESRPIAYDANDFQFYMNTGFGFAHRGYKYKISSDKALYLKESGSQIFAGFGIEYWGVGSNSSDYPISLTVNGIVYNNFLTKSYINKELVDVNLFDIVGFIYGVSTKIDMVIIDGASVDLLFYLNYDSYFDEQIYIPTNSIFKNHVINFGLTIQFENGIYDTIVF